MPIQLQESASSHLALYFFSRKRQDYVLGQIKGCPVGSPAVTPPLTTACAAADPVCVCQQMILGLCKV